MNSEMMLVEVLIHTVPDYLARMLITGDVGVKCAVVLDDLSGLLNPEALWFYNDQRRSLLIR